MIQPNGLIGLDSRLISAQLDTCRTKNQMRLINRSLDLLSIVAISPVFLLIFVTEKWHSSTYFSRGLLKKIHSRRQPIIFMPDNRSARMCIQSSSNCCPERSFYRESRRCSYCNCLKLFSLLTSLWFFFVFSFHSEFTTGNVTRIWLTRQSDRLHTL